MKLEINFQITYMSPMMILILQLVDSLLQFSRKFLPILIEFIRKGMTNSESDLCRNFHESSDYLIFMQLNLKNL